MTYLNVDLDFLDHPKTRRLVGQLGHGAEVLVLRLWTYCGRYHPGDGALIDYDAQEIESLAGWTGDPGAMVQAMVKVGFLDQTHDGVVIHDWKEHQGHIIAYRKRGKQMAKARWARAGHAASNATSNAASIAGTRPIDDAASNAGPPSASDAASNAPTYPILPNRPNQPSQQVCVSQAPVAHAADTHTDDTHAAETHTPGSATDLPWPSLEEVRQRADIRGISKDCAEKWWHLNDSRGGCDQHGQPIRRWESSLVAFAATWRAVEAQQRTRTDSRPPRTPCDHSKGFFHGTPFENHPPHDYSKGSK